MKIKITMYFIYRLYINNTTVYIGKTTNVKKRYNKHKSDCFNEKKKEYNYYLYMTIRQLFITKEQFYDFVKMEVLYSNIPEIYNKKMENLVINIYKDFGNDLWNINNANYDEKEYYENNKDKIKENKKEFYKNNKDKIKEYYENNKDKIKENKKEFYKNNTDKINEKQREKINCPECNKLLNKRCLKRHIKRKH